VDFPYAAMEQAAGPCELRAAGSCWQVSFLECDPGCFDRDQDRVGPGPSPLASDTALTMCPEYTEAAMVAGDGLQPSTRRCSA